MVGSSEPAMLVITVPFLIQICRARCASAALVISVTGDLRILVLCFLLPSSPVLALQLFRLYGPVHSARKY